MLSPLVVISWWSNCLGLVCLQRLVQYIRNRPIYVVQVGKSAVQKQHFREQLPEGVAELFYPDDAPGEHSRVLEEVVLRQLPSLSGLWFVDHDLFLEADSKNWLATADYWLGRTDYSLCLPAPLAGPAITQPAFWLSPARWPSEMASFDPIPFTPQNTSRRPDLYRHNGELRMPMKDTLVSAKEALCQQGRVGYFPLTESGTAVSPLPPFPAHTHLGGLFLFAGPLLPDRFRVWTQSTVTQFSHFYAQCPDDLLAIEDPILWQRFLEFKEAIHVDTTRSIRLRKIRST